MGHLINPTSNRLSLNSYWNSNWSLNSIYNFSLLYKKDYILFFYLDWFLNKSKLVRLDFLISHYKLYKINDKIYINLYYYDNNIQNEFKFYDFIFSKTKFSKKNFDIIQSFIIKVVLSNIYWYLLSNPISFYLNKINFNEKFYFNVFNLNFFNLSAEGINNYIAIKLQKKYSLNWILRPILQDLSLKIKRKNLLGYKILCKGRFTRKQIATKEWVKKGALKLNTLSHLIKYNCIKVRLKYGICGIKIWLDYGLNNFNLFTRHISLIYPLQMPFRYSFNNGFLLLYINYWLYIYIRISFLKMRNYKFYNDFIFFKLKLLLFNYVFNILKVNNPFFYFYKMKFLRYNQIQLRLKKNINDNYIYE